MRSQTENDSDDIKVDAKWVVTQRKRHLLLHLRLVWSLVNLLPDKRDDLFAGTPGLSMLRPGQLLDMPHRPHSHGT